MEFNLEWSVDMALKNENNIRDLFYSLGRGIGITDNYWFIHPNSISYNNKNAKLKGFYHSHKFSVKIDEILYILHKKNLLVN